MQLFTATYSYLEIILLLYNYYSNWRTDIVHNSVFISLFFYHVSKMQFHYIYIYIYTYTTMQKTWDLFILNF